ncbi:hypothetical protein ACEQ8H_008041 [Pleosporales sp. CAS-2024a]
MEDGDDMDVAPDGASSKRADSMRSPCAVLALQSKQTDEKKIDRIEDRLAGIENVLSNLATRLNDLDLRRDSAEPGSQSRSTRRAIWRTPGTGEEAPTPAPFEGETTINTQSDYVRELITKAVGSDPATEHDAEVKSALHALNGLVLRQGQATSSTTHALVDSTLADMDPETLAKPRWDDVNSMIDQAYRNTDLSLAFIFPFQRLKNFKDIISDAYYNPRQCGSARRLLTYSILHIIMEDYVAFPLEGMNKEDNKRYLEQCRVQIEVAISQLDVFMVASYENIMALMLGSAWAIDMSRPSLTSAMISTAARLCQTLGYHRYQTMQKDTEEERQDKMHIFWMIYMFDKMVSLRLGRASFIQDYDISLPYFGDNRPASDVPDAKLMLTYWCKVARVQGQIYEKLFSPAAFNRSAEERSRTAVELVKAMNQAWHERGDARVAEFLSTRRVSNIHGHPAVANFTGPNDMELPSMRKSAASRSPSVRSPEQTTVEKVMQLEDVYFCSDTVIYYSTCALIQRAVSPDQVTFSEECLESSRAALVAHMRCNTRFNVPGNEFLWSGYVHWTILQAPFTPFIVLVCHLIQNKNDTDLQSLEDFVTSLESCRTLSEGADKLYKMCHLFLRVAKLYLQAKARNAKATLQTFPPSQPAYYPSSTDGQHIGPAPKTDFDPYLSALGLMPNATWPMADYANTQVSSTGFAAFPQGQTMGVASVMGNPGTGMSCRGGSHNPVQDWFSGSRYLMGMMEAGDEMQMPDFEL